EGHYDRFRERIMYPIRDQRGRAIGFGGRAIGDENPKYLNSPETPVFHKGRELYGLHQARQQHRNLERLYLVEGYMDVIALAQYGIHNAVATLGTAATADQIQRLFRHSGQLVFCFDGDEAGKKAAWRALENTLPQLSEGREARFMFMPEGDDPDSYVRQHGAESFLDDKQYLPLSDFLLDGLQAGSDPDSREGRAKLLDAVLPFINKLPRSGLREILIGDVALRCKVERQVLEDMLKGLPDKQRRPVGRPVRPAPRKGDELVGNLVSCLLYRPALAALVEEVESLRDIPVDGVNFLIDLLDFIHQSPDTNCAAIVENWRDTPYHERLNALAAGLSVYDEDGFDIERLFRDTLTKLQGKRLQQEIAAKAGKGLKDLSEADKEALRKGIASLKST
ncbi:MAG: toprim domain-containing protein, partial [Gammaproteobacteria bacterium]